MVLVCGALVGMASDRSPADATAPLEIVGTASITSPLPISLKIATFNIHAGKGRDDLVDLGRTAAALRDVDLVALQEVDNGWWGNPSQAEELGERLGMQSVFVPAERRWFHDASGTGLLTRHPLKFIHRIPLPNTTGKTQRVAFLSEVSVGGRLVRILAVHVATGPDRRAQMHAVARLFRGLETPAILIGDLNTTVDDPMLAGIRTDPETTTFLGTDEFVDERTSIDWIIARGMRCVRHEIRENSASDHPAIHAELDFIDSAPVSESCRPSTQVSSVFEPEKSETPKKQ